MSPPPVARRVIAAALVAAAIAFLGWTATRNWRELRSYDWDVEPWRFALSLLAHVGVLVWGVFVWSRVIEAFTSARPPLGQLTRIWFLSSAARYVPGSVWQFVAAAQLAPSAGLPGGVLLTSLLLHTGFSLLAAAVVSALALPQALLGREVAAGWSIVVPLGAALLVHPAVLRLALRRVPRRLGGGADAWSVSWPRTLFLLGLSVVSWVLYGAAYYLFVRSLTPLQPRSLPALTGVNALSFLTGYVVLVAPAGLGVRESAMTVLLGPLVPPGVAAVIAVLSRLWTIAAELLGAIPAVLSLRAVARPGAAHGGGAGRAEE